MIGPLAKATFGAVCIFLLSFAVQHLALAHQSNDLVKGRVIGVKDGDTIVVLIGANPITVRLHGLDCPELNQPWGTQAKSATSSLVFGKNVTVRFINREKYGRYVGRVLLEDGRDLGSELIKGGYAWWYKKYASGDLELERFEKLAREKRRGLWIEKNPVPPWQFRRTKDLSNEDRQQLSPVLGNRRSRIYHRRDCPGFMKVSINNRVPFSAPADAENAGFRVAKDCPG